MRRHAKCNFELKKDRPTETHRMNNSSSSIMEHYQFKWFNPHIPFLDHLISQIHDRLCTFGATNRLKAQKLLPKHVVSLTRNDTDAMKIRYKGIHQFYRFGQRD